MLDRALSLANTRPKDWQAVYDELGVQPPRAPTLDFTTGRPRRVPARPRIAEELRQSLILALDAACRGQRRREFRALDMRDSMWLSGAHGRPYVEDGRILLMPGSVITPTFEAFVGYTCALLRSPVFPLRIRRCAQCRAFFAQSRGRGQPFKCCSSKCKEAQSAEMEFNRHQRAIKSRKRRAR